MRPKSVSVAVLADVLGDHRGAATGAGHRACLHRAVGQVDSALAAHRSECRGRSCPACPLTSTHAFRRVLLASQKEESSGISAPAGRVGAFHRARPEVDRGRRPVVVGREDLGELRLDPVRGPSPPISRSPPRAVFSPRSSGWPKRCGYSRTHFSIRWATGLRSTAVVSQPSRSASSGMAPPPAKQSRTLGGPSG